MFNKVVIISVCFSLFLAQLVHAQKILTVDLDRIEEITSDIQSENYYPSLLTKCQSMDTSLTNMELHFLYYGQYFQSNYHPDTPDKQQRSMFKLLKARKYKAALDSGLVSFNNTPLNLRTLFGISTCYLNLEDAGLAEKYMSMYYKLMEVILETGNGRKAKTAFVVMSIDDEYEIVNSMGKIVRKQKLIDHKTDLLYLNNISGRKNIVNFKKIYFNVEIMLMKTAFDL